MAMKKVKIRYIKGKTLRENKGVSTVKTRGK